MQQRAPPRPLKHPAAGALHACNLTRCVQCFHVSSQVLNCITPLFSVLSDACVRRTCLQLFAAIACAVRAKTASDGKARVCVCASCSHNALKRDNSID